MPIVRRHIDSYSLSRRIKYSLAHVLRILSQDATKAPWMDMKFENHRPISVHKLPECPITGLALSQSSGHAVIMSRHIP